MRKRMPKISPDNKEPPKNPHLAAAVCRRRAQYRYPMGPFSGQRGSPGGRDAYWAAGIAAGGGVGILRWAAAALEVGDQLLKAFHTVLSRA